MRICDCIFRLRNIADMRIDGGTAGKKLLVVDLQNWTSALLQISRRSGFESLAGALVTQVVGISACHIEGLGTEPEVLVVTSGLNWEIESVP